MWGLKGTWFWGLKVHGIWGLKVHGICIGEFQAVDKTVLVRIQWRQNAPWVTNDKEDTSWQDVSFFLKKKNIYVYSM